MIKSLLFIVLGVIFSGINLKDKNTNTTFKENKINSFIVDSTIYFIDTLKTKGLLFSFHKKRIFESKSINIFIENITQADLNSLKRKSISHLLENGYIYITHSGFFDLLFQSNFDKNKKIICYNDSFEKDHQILQNNLRSNNAKLDVYSVRTEFLVILINSNFLRKFNNMFVNEKILPRYGYVKIITPNYFYKIN